MDRLLIPFRRYADFRGRSTRTEFWLFALLMVVLFILAMVLDTVLGLGGAINRYSYLEGGTAGAGAWGNGGILTVALWLVTIVPGLSVAVRRLHDANKSGWWLLIGFVPLIGAIVLFVFYVQPSWPQPNLWGAPPA